MIYETPQNQSAAVTCAPGGAADRKQIEEMDRQVNNYVDVALYNRKQIPPQELLNLIRSHTVVIWDGTVCQNLHAGMPEQRLAPDPTAHEVAIEVADGGGVELIEKTPVGERYVDAHRGGVLEGR